MIVNLVYVWVKNESIEAFQSACRENARASRREPLVASFNIVQESADPARFVLIEAFRNESGPDAHRETDHYKKWRETVAPMMREDRRALKCVEVDFAV